jgi:hypothetical protein
MLFGNLLGKTQSVAHFTSHPVSPSGQATAGETLLFDPIHDKWR